MLMLAEVGTVSLISSTVGIQRRFIYKWVARFNEQRIAGLVDKHVRAARQPGQRQELTLTKYWRRILPPPSK